MAVVPPFLCASQRNGGTFHNNPKTNKPLSEWNRVTIPQLFSDENDSLETLLSSSTTFPLVGESSLHKGAFIDFVIPPIFPKVNKNLSKNDKFF